MEKKLRETTNLGIDKMKSKRQVKRKLGHVVRIRVCRLTQTWCLTSLIKSNNSSNWHHEQNELASRDTETKPGTLRSNDADGNEDVKKQKTKNNRFNKQNNNFARA